ncbi:MAG: helix-turn-helix transcriptional regulator [Ruminococcaceae bacterium]|nr:helix-turn-helix transcriptional regulator [Oscillospiraceae bacterium]
MERPIGELTKKYRGKHRLSLRKFAELCGVSKTYLFQLENGKTGHGDYPSPSLAVTMAIADAMHMDPLRLFREIGFSVDARREQKDARPASAAIKPYEYIPVTLENLKDAARRNGIMLLPFSLPVLGGNVYIPEFKKDGHVITHQVTEVSGGIFSAVSELYGTVVFNLYDIDRTVFTDRDAAYGALEQWNARHLSARAEYVEGDEE